MTLLNATVKDLKKLGAGAYFLCLSPHVPLNFEPGQHTQIQFRDHEGSFLHYYSLANAPRHNGELEFFIQAVDVRFKNIMENLLVGTKLEMTQAQGNFRLTTSSRDVVLVGGGTGIAPLRAIFEHLTQGFTLREMPHKVHVLYGVRHADSIFALEDFLPFHHANLDSIKICITAEQGNLPGVKTGRVTQHLNDLILANADYYLCGPPAMLDAARAHLLAYGIDAQHIFQEGY